MDQFKEDVNEASDKVNNINELVLENHYNNQLKKLVDKHASEIEDLGLLKDKIRKAKEKKI